MTSIFPDVTPSNGGRAATLPLYTDVKWDFDADKPLFVGGEPVMVSGREAVRTWAYNALSTVRGRWPIWTRGYGSDCETLIGQPFSAELKTAECARYVRECLLCCPYITDAECSDVALDGDNLTITASFKSIYGEATINV